MKGQVLQLSQLRVRSGTARGQDHIADDSPLQDTVSHRLFNDMLVIVASDGCGSPVSVNSAFGSRYLADLFIATVYTLSRRMRWVFEADTIEHARRNFGKLSSVLFREMVDDLRLQALKMGFGDSKLAAEYIFSTLLATIRAQIITPRWTIQLGSGDGIYKVGKQIFEVDHHNHPRYLAIAALDHRYRPPLVMIEEPVHLEWDSTPTAFDVEVFDNTLIDHEWAACTDGASPFLRWPDVKLIEPDGLGTAPDRVGGLDQFFDSDHILWLEQAVQLRLNVLVRNNLGIEVGKPPKPLFADDIGVIIVREDTETEEE